MLGWVREPQLGQGRADEWRGGVHAGTGERCTSPRPHALESTGGLEETQPYTCEENSWRLGECPTRPNTRGKLAVIRSAEGWARTQKPWLQTSYHLPHLTTPG